MDPGDEHVGEDARAAAMAGLSATSILQEDGASGGPSSASANEEAGGQQQQQLDESSSSRAPLEEVLKGLIISQIKGPYVHVEEGLLNLLRGCLVAEHPFLTSASLSGHVDHFQSVDDEDLGWGCGWRNIQILCSFLMAEDPESRGALFNGAGFVPDIPALQTWLQIAWAQGFDEPGAEYFNWAISGTRKWIGTTECAALLRSFGVRAKIVSFTALGGKRTRTSDGSEKQFGSSPITLSDDDEPETAHRSDILNERKCPGKTLNANTRGGAITCNECGKICLHGTKYRGIVGKDSDLCDDCMKAASQKGGSGGDLHVSPGREEGEKFVHPGAVESSGSTPSSSSSTLQRHMELSSSADHHWNFECDGCGNPLKGRRYKSLMRKKFDLCSSCMREVDESGIGERGSHKDYVIIEEYPAIRTCRPPPPDHGEDVVCEEDGGLDQGEKAGDVHEGVTEAEVENQDAQQGGDPVGEMTEKECGGQSCVEGKDPAKGLEASSSSENAAGFWPLENGERRKAGMHSTTSTTVRNSDVNHQHLIEWVWSYFTEDSTRRFAPNAVNQRNLVNMSKRSPLYFQHRGHSRTIVGIERRRKPSGVSEDVYLLVLDPSVSTELLVKSLRENSGWQKLIKNDVHTLKEAEYQLCYADPGIAVGEELEQLKILSSLRYSYYSK